jgi:hypothetical protein
MANRNIPNYCVKPRGKDAPAADLHDVGRKSADPVYGRESQTNMRAAVFIASSMM